MMNSYEKQAKDFCKATNTQIIIEFKEKKLNPWNATGISSTWYHNLYKVTIKRNGKQFSFTFTDSASHTQNGEKPTEYDILACLQKYEVGTFEDFCFEFGYEMYADYPEEATKEGYNKETYKTYKAVVKEYNNVVKLFEDCLGELAEIQ